MAGMFPFNSGCSNCEVTPDYDGVAHRFNGLSLKEIAEKKLHHGSDRFISPFTTIDYGGRLPSVLKWRLTPSKFRGLYPKEQVVSIDINWQKILTPRGLSLTYLTHSSILIQDQGTRILIDPVFYGLSFFIKNFTPLNFNGQAAPSMDYILITHGHYDHLDKQTLGLFSADTPVITPLGYGDIMKDLKKNRHKELDWYDSTGGDGLEITLLPCHHWTMRNPIVGANRSLWGAYLIKTSTGPTIFVSGDTAYFEGIKEIGAAYKIDLAIINLGAYEPRWMMKNSHISPVEAVTAFRDLGAKKLAIAHWGSFRLGDEPVFMPPVELKQELEKQGLLHVLLPIRHGQTLTL